MTYHSAIAWMNMALQVAEDAPLLCRTKKAQEVHRTIFLAIAERWRAAADALRPEQPGET